MSGAVAATLLGGPVGLAVYEAEEAKKDARRAARATERANKIQTAQGQIQDINRRRQNIREERVRKAQILQASQNLGVAGGSGEFGATGALSTLTSSRNAAIRGGQSAAISISELRNEAARAMVRSQEHQFTSDLGFQISGQAFSAFAGGAG